MASTINGTSTGNGGLISTGDDSGILNIQTNETTAITVDASQNVGIGTTSPSYRVDAVGSGSPSTGILRSSSNLTNSTTKYGYYTVGHYTNATAPFGFIQGESNSTENNVHIGGGAGEVTAATRIDFYTAANNTTSSGTERMRITSAGELLVNGTAAPVNGLKMAITNGSVKWSFGPDGSGNYCVFNASSAGVYVTNGGTSWTGTSDERLKTDLIPITNGLQKVNSLRSVTGRFKTDEEGTSRSFLIAQDVKTVFPEAVNTLNDEIGTLGLAYTDVIPLLVASRKELKAINDTQAETINALTARIVALETA